MYNRTGVALVGGRGKAYWEAVADNEPAVYGCHKMMGRIIVWGRASSSLEILQLGRTSKIILLLRGLSLIEKEGRREKVGVKLRKERKGSNT